ncbi:MAG: fused MFS/spermidine synthase [Kiritimatiellaeota bacterium]|nr:fused MFS/spermidine synthase [Kiritimatiellota bacterium]
MAGLLFLGGQMGWGLVTVFFSGLCAMVAELVAGRLVAPFFGQSARTWAALMGVTLAGLTAGNLAGGGLAGRACRPGPPGGGCPGGAPAPCPGPPAPGGAPPAGWPGSWAARTWWPSACPSASWSWWRR